MRPAALLALGLSLPAAGDTQVWLVGGGHTLEQSQSQIEANVRWLEEVLRSEGLGVRTYFGRGHEPGPDVVYWSGRPPPLPEEVFARVIGDYSSVGLDYRRHELRELQGGTAKHELTAALERDFATLTPGDELLFVYNGHGGIDREDTRNNHLKLWGDERLTVVELERLFDAVPKGVPARFVLTQCYSGAFQSLVYDDPLRASGVRGERCGFMAESELRLAEGCELTGDQDDFRDYTTYFFAALSGATRFGEPLASDRLDRDRDGAISFREAHFHALVASHSADLSRSTSEEYLERWSPWFLRWDTLTDNPDSIYWRLAEEVAARYGWDTRSASLAALYKEHAAAQQQADERRRGVRRQVEAQRDGLEAEIAARWPALAAGEIPLPDGAAVSERLGSKWPEIAAEIAADVRYDQLVRLQESLVPLGNEARERTRTLTQVEKIYRLRHLARLERALQTYGSADARQRYEQLVQCEAGSLRGSMP